MAGYERHLAPAAATSARRSLQPGGTAGIVTYDDLQANGVIHSVDTVLLPQ